MSSGLQLLPPPPRDKENILLWANAVWKHLRRSRIVAGNGLTETPTADGRILSASGLIGLRTANFEFGLLGISGTTLTFNGGTVILGTETITIAETEVTAAGGTEGSPFFAQVEIDHETPASSRILPVTATLSQSDGYTRLPLLKCYLESAALKFPSGGYLCHVGSLFLPSFYSTV